MTPSVSLHHVIFVIHICCIIPNIYNLMISNLFGIQKISCQSDGTRISGKTEGFGLCSMSLFINYFFFIALDIWIMILSRSWYTQYQETNNKTYPRRSRNQNLSIAGYNIGINFIHLFSWTVSLLMTIIALVVGQDNNAIEGNSHIGIIATLESAFYPTKLQNPLHFLYVFQSYLCYLCYFGAVDGVANHYPDTSKQQRLNQSVKLI